MKVRVHYLNGMPYTINHLFINYTEWEGDSVKIHGELFPDLTVSYVKGYVTTLEGVMFLEEICKEDGTVEIHFNPSYDMSVLVDVMTANSRCKANNSDIPSLLGETRKDLNVLGLKV